MLGLRDVRRMELSMYFSTLEGEGGGGGGVCRVDFGGRWEVAGVGGVVEHFLAMGNYFEGKSKDYMMIFVVVFF